MSVLSRGYKINQIAVLVRKKRQAVLVSEELVKNGIKILSSESLLPSTQFDMYSSENAGLVKFDLWDFQEDMVNNFHNERFFKNIK